MIAMTMTGSVESRPEIRLMTAVAVRQTEIDETTGTEVRKYLCPASLSKRRPLITFKNPYSVAFID